jgi:hypothetical protein
MPRLHVSHARIRRACARAHTHTQPVCALRSFFRSPPKCLGPQCVQERQHGNDKSYMLGMPQRTRRESEVFEDSDTHHRVLLGALALGNRGRRLGGGLRGLTRHGRGSAPHDTGGHPRSAMLLQRTTCAAQRSTPSAAAHVVVAVDCFSPPPPQKDTLSRQQRQGHSGPSSQT